jgi:heptosyltransferase-3
VTPSLPDPRRILVVHVTRIGDTVMATPALRALAAHWPAAAITFLGHPKRAAVIEHLPYVQRVGAITKRRALARGWLAGERWDLGVVFGFDEALVRYALRACARVAAFRQQDERLNARLFRAVEHPPHNALHGVDRLLLLPRALGIAPRSRALEYQVAPAEADAAARRLAADGVGAGARPLVGFLIESFPTKPYRDWPAERFAALARRILEAFPSAHFLLFGGALPEAKVASLRAALGPRLTTYAGKLELRETAALMARVDLYVGVDTGPTHIAGALRLPMVALYHCLHPGSLLAPPDHPGLAVVEHPARGTPACTERSPLAEITVDRVWREVAPRLDAALAAAPA